MNGCLPWSEKVQIDKLQDLETVKIMIFPHSRAIINDNPMPVELGTAGVDCDIARMLEKRLETPCGSASEALLWQWPEISYRYT